MKAVVLAHAVAVAGTTTPRTANESVCLPGETLDLDGALRAADHLRRKVARTARGAEGSFVGYDELDVAGWANERTEGPVVVVAAVIDEGPSSQTVEYTAVACDHSFGDHRPASSGHLLLGRGKTVGLHNTATRTIVEPSPFSKAPLRR